MAEASTASIRKTVTEYGYRAALFIFGETILIQGRRSHSTSLVPQISSSRRHIHWRYGWLEFSRWDCPWWRYVYYISILVFTDTTVTSEAFSRFMHVLLGLYLWVSLTCPSLIDNSHPYYSWEFATSLDFDYQFLTGKKSFRWPLVSELLLLIHFTHLWSDFLFRRSICPAFYANRDVSQQSIASIIKLISH